MQDTAVELVSGFLHMNCLALEPSAGCCSCWLAAIQVSKATTLNDFDASTVQLSASASARPGGSRNDTLLQQTAEKEITLTRTPGMAVSIALVTGQTGIFSSPGVWNIALPV